MRTILLTCFVLHVFSVVMFLIHLWRADYPRIVKWSRGEDVLIGIVANGAILGWLGWALWL